MHFPGQGSVRITANVPDLGLTYQSTRRQPIATLMFPGATFEHKRVVYTLDVTAIYPEVPGIADDARFDAFRRNWLNILQLNPAYAGLANNTASTSCAFCYYEFGDIAALTPPLAEGLTALDFVRVTLDQSSGRRDGIWTGDARQLSDAVFGHVSVHADRRGRLCARGWQR